MTLRTLVVVVAASSLFVIDPRPLPAETPVSQDIGFVLDLRGEWEVAGAPPVPLKIGRAVPAGGTIRARSSESSWFITVVLFDGSTTLTRSCHNVAECEKPLVLPGRAEADSFWARALKTMGALLSRQDESLIPVMARGDLIADKEVQANEAVVALSAGSVDLAPVMRGSAPGRYTLILEIAARRGTASQGAPLSAAVEWTPGQAMKIRAGRLAPGLYSVTVLPDREEVYAPTGASAWILVSGEREFEKRSRAFDEAVQLTRNWSGPVREQAVRRFLRACLEILAQDSGGTGGAA